MSIVQNHMSHLIVQDPMLMQFNLSQQLYYQSPEDLIESELLPDEEKPTSYFGLEAIEPYLDRIPKMEADFLELYFKHKMKQEQIADLFHISQAGVSYRMAKAIKRIQFLYTIPILDHDEFEMDLLPRLGDCDFKIMLGIYETTCQSLVAARMGLTQGCVRHRFLQNFKRIKGYVQEDVEIRNLKIKAEHCKTVYWTDEAVQDALKKSAKESKWAKYYTVFYAIQDRNWNKLHEVSLPQFTFPEYEIIGM